jgi:hypothetical protein
MNRLTALSQWVWAHLSRLLAFVLWLMEGTLFFSLVGTLSPPERVTVIDALVSLAIVSCSILIGILAGAEWVRDRYQHEYEEVE